MANIIVTVVITGLEEDTDFKRVAELFANEAGDAPSFRFNEVELLDMVVDN